MLNLKHQPWKLLFPFEDIMLNFHILIVVLYNRIMKKLGQSHINV